MAWKTMTEAQGRPKVVTVSAGVGIPRLTFSSYALKVGNQYEVLTDGKGFRLSPKTNVRRKRSGLSARRHAA